MLVCIPSIHGVAKNQSLRKSRWRNEVAGLTRWMGAGRGDSPMHLVQIVIIAPRRHSRTTSIAPSLPSFHSMVARSLPLLQPLPFLNLCRRGVACRTWSWLHNLSNCIRRRKHCSQRLFQSNHG